MPKQIKKTSTGKKSSASKSKEALPPLPSREATEGVLAEFLGGIAQRGAHAAVQKAQQIMYDAWDASTKTRRVSLAKKALNISPDCADAYVLLAEETAQSLDEALELYRKGVEAGERALGKRVFSEDVGHFWGFLETRPYMRARAGLAGCLWDAGQREEAVEHYWDMLRLNPGDNQGIRYELMPRLIELGRDKEAEKLFKQYRDDGMATWMYSRVLLDFRKHGDSLGAGKSLEAALKENKYVPEYLLGKRRMPRTLPPYYGYGDENEAVIYVHGNKAAWQATPGGLGWLVAAI